MNKWWKDPRLDDEGTYDYLVEELPENNSSWSTHVTKCDDCGKERHLTRTDTHYFYCWDGWDSMSYTTCWKCHLKSWIRSKMSKMKKKLSKCGKILDLRAYIVFRKFCKNNNIDKQYHKDLWEAYYDFWSDEHTRRLVKEGKK